MRVAWDESEIGGALEQAEKALGEASLAEPGADRRSVAPVACPVLLERIRGYVHATGSQAPGPQAASPQAASPQAASPQAASPQAARAELER